MSIASVLEKHSWQKPEKNLLLTSKAIGMVTNHSPKGFSPGLN
jgi:hypothetical protein